MLLLSVDVYYRENDAVVGGVLFERWDDEKPLREWAVRLSKVAEYESGQFYKRELPPIMELLKRFEKIPDYIVIDGHVYLDADQRAGLGKYLHDMLEGKCAIIGVAKSRFKDTPIEAEVFRGASKRPLYVTAIGIDEATARDLVKQMHGKHRLPTLIKRADQLSRNE